MVEGPGINLKQRDMKTSKAIEADYIDHLNELPVSYDYESDEWIIGGKNRVHEYFERYGEALRDHDPIAFNVGLNEFEKENYG
jgi:hypothetical protein